MVKKVVTGKASAGTEQQDVEHEANECKVLGLSLKVIEIILFTLTVALYLNSLKAQFAFDDAVAIERNKVCDSIFLLITNFYSFIQGH
jgi:hypothetical protein